MSQIKKAAKKFCETESSLSCTYCCVGDCCIGTAFIAGAKWLASRASDKTEGTHERQLLAMDLELLAEGKR